MLPLETGPSSKVKMSPPSLVQNWPGLAAAPSCPGQPTVMLSWSRARAPPPPRRRVTSSPPMLIVTWPGSAPGEMTYCRDCSFWSRRLGLLRLPERVSSAMATTLLEWA